MNVSWFLIWTSIVNSKHPSTLATCSTLPLLCLLSIIGKFVALVLTESLQLINPRPNQKQSVTLLPAPLTSHFVDFPFLHLGADMLLSNCQRWVRCRTICAMRYNANQCLQWTRGYHVTASLSFLQAVVGFKFFVYRKSHIFSFFYFKKPFDSVTSNANRFTDLIKFREALLYNRLNPTTAFRWPPISFGNVVCELMLLSRWGFGLSHVWFLMKLTWIVDCLSNTLYHLLYVNSQQMWSQLYHRNDILFSSALINSPVIVRFLNIIVWFLDDVSFKSVKAAFLTVLVINDLLLIWGLVSTSDFVVWTRAQLWQDPDSENVITAGFFFHRAIS